jgi:dihydrofolate reductase
MRKLSVFNSVSLDGYFTDRDGDVKWAHRPDPEWDAFVEANAEGEGSLLLGRVTYEMMAAYWPTPAAMENDPVVARRMNELPKLVCSRTLDEVAWSNTRLIRGDLVTEIRALKQAPGAGITILGSGSIVSQLTQAGLIDEYQFVVIPVVLGEGRTLFEGVKERVSLRLLESRAFRNGNVYVRYQPAGDEAAELPG